MTNCEIEKFIGKTFYMSILVHILNINICFLKFDFASIVVSVVSFRNTARTRLFTVHVVVFATLHQISHLQRIFVVDHVSCRLCVVLKTPTRAVRDGESCIVKNADDFFIGYKSSPVDIFLSKCFIVSVCILQELALDFYRAHYP